MQAKGIKVLSLFDGISCARVALDRAGIEVAQYYSSEIDKYAMQISAKNWPEIWQVGSVDRVMSDFKGRGGFYPAMHYRVDVDLLIGGSPCQDLSIAKKDRKGLDGDRSGLFWEYVRILNEVKPKYFILENVASMPKEAKALISETLGVEPIMIDAALVSAQRRKRLFWVGKLVGDKYEQVMIPLPEDRGIFLKDILQLESEVDEKYYIKDSTLQTILEKMRQGKPLAQAFRIHQTDGKGVTLSALGGGCGAKTGLYCVSTLTERRTEEAKRIRSESMKNGKDWSPRRGKELVMRDDGKANTLTTGITKEHLVVLVGKARGKNPGYESSEKTATLTGSSWQHNYFLKLYNEGKLVVRKLTPIECERLQSINKDGYTSCVSDAQRYKACGNAFNVEVIAHILKSMKL